MAEPNGDDPVDRPTREDVRRHVALELACQVRRESTDSGIVQTAEAFAAFLDDGPSGTPALEMADRLAEALRLTQEYVGPTVLPAQIGWSWFDALEEYRLWRGGEGTRG